MNNESQFPFQCWSRTHLRMCSTQTIQWDTDHSSRNFFYRIFIDHKFMKKISKIIFLLSTVRLSGRVGSFSWGQYDSNALPHVPVRPIQSWLWKTPATGKGTLIQLYDPLWLKSPKSYMKVVGNNKSTIRGKLSFRWNSLGGSYL